MSADILLPDGPDPDVAAAELALGLIDGEERAVALRRVLAEPGFAQELDRWRAHLAQLFYLWPESAAPVGVFDRVERSIDGPAVAPVAAVTRPSRFWQGVAATSSLIAASLLMVILLRPEATLPPVAPVVSPPPVVASLPPQILVAAIDPVATGKPIAAIYDPATGGLRLTEAALADANRSAELWIIAGDGVPHSLGLLHTAGGTNFTVASENRARLAAGATLAVSLEPVGGSPTGLPTGPVVATGALSQV